MNFIKQNIEDLFLIEPEPYKDERGMLRRIFCKKELSSHNIKFEIKQSNISENKKGISILSSLLIIIISLVALLVIVDTFKSFLITIIPGLDFYLSSLYATLIDIILFFKDLLK